MGAGALFGRKLPFGYALLFCEVLKLSFSCGFDSFIGLLSFIVSLLLYIRAAPISEFPGIPKPDNLFPNGLLSDDLLDDIYDICCIFLSG